MMKNLKEYISRPGAGFMCILLLVFFNSFSAEYPVELLPPHINLILDVGERPDISLDGTKFIYISEPGGDVYERDIETGVETLLTGHARPEGHGYYRALYMSDGNYLLTCGDDRHRAYMQVLDKSLTAPPVEMGELVREGPTVSRTQNKVSWTRRQKGIWVADIVYNGGVPELANVVKIMSSGTLPDEADDLTNYNGDIEPQNFRPPTDHELIFSRYGFSSTGKYSSETWLYDFETGEVSNQSNRHEWYDEPEGVFPDGEYTLVECDMFLNISQHAQVLDLYRMKIDGVGDDMVRLTNFGDTELSDGVKFKANQGVVSDDGSFMLFGEGRSNTNDQPGSGFGIYHFDFTQYSGFDVNVPEEKPCFSLTPSVIGLQMTRGDASTLNPVQVKISNKGTGNLTNVTAVSNDSWIEVTVDDNEGNEQQITLSFNNTTQDFSIGQHWGTVSISADGIETRKVAVILDVSKYGKNLAFEKPAFASSVEDANYGPENAFDEDEDSRWSSLTEDPSWIYVDLGGECDITTVVLIWESAHSSVYDIQVSDDAETWTTIHSEDNSAGGTEEISLSGTGRYVRMYGRERATTWGHSLYEFQVYGTQNTTSAQAAPVIKEVQKDLQLSGSTIQITLDRAEPVTITLLDMKGKTLRTVHQGMCKPGVQTFSLFDRSLSNGMFIVKTVVGAQTTTSVIQHVDSW